MKLFDLNYYECLHANEDIDFVIVCDNEEKYFEMMKFFKSEGYLWADGTYPDDNDTYREVMDNVQHLDRKLGFCFSTICTGLKNQAITYVTCFKHDNFEVFGKETQVLEASDFIFEEDKFEILSNEEVEEFIGSLIIE